MLHRTRRTTLSAATLAALLFTFAPAAFAQNGDAPAQGAPDAASTAKADEVLDRANEVTFGENAEEGDIKTVRMKGSFSMPAMNINGSMTTLLDAEGGRMLSVTEIPGFGTEKQGVIDGVAWSDSTTMGARLLEGDEAAQIMQEADFYADMKYKEYYPEREYLGMEEVHGQQCHKLALTHADDGDTVTRWYSVETGRLVQQTITLDSPMGEIEATLRFDDYRDIGGMRMPFKTINAFAGMEQVITFEEIEVNVPLEDDDFAPPAEVQALIDAG